MKTLIALLLLASFASAAQPNIILLMGDDHGWEETGYHGHPHVKTPVLDEIAATGQTAGKVANTVLYRRDPHAHVPPQVPTAPLTDDEIDQLRQRSLFGVLWNVAPSMKQDSLVKDLKLTDAQRPKTHELLRQRREKFLAIVDSTPPPSIMLSRLAPSAQRLAAEPAKK